MVKFSNIVVVYFLIAAVMWGGGVISWSETGVAQTFVTDPATGQTNETLANQVSQADEPIRNALNAIGGGTILALWGVFKQLLGVLFWPITVTLAVGAPSEVIVLSGALSVSFFMAFLLFIRGAG